MNILKKSLLPLAVLSCATLAAHSQTVIDSDTTYDGVPFTIDPTEDLIVTGAADPLLLLQNEAVGTGAATVTIGDDGSSGRMRVESGSTFESGSQTIVGHDGGTGHLVITGADTEYISGSTIRIGNTGGEGLMEVLDGAYFNNSATTLRIAEAAGGSGVLTISGANTYFQSGNWVSIGGAGMGTLNVQNGALMVIGGPGGNTSTSNRLQIGQERTNFNNGRGTVTVTGANSRIEVEDFIHLGRYQSTSELRIENGGYVVGSSTSIYNTSDNSLGLVLISGEDSVLESTSSGNAIRFGRDGDQGFANFRVENGGAIMTGDSEGDVMLESSAAILSGTGGTIHGNVLNTAGTLAPALEFAFADTTSLNPDVIETIGDRGVFTMTGNYTQSENAILQLHIGGASDYDSIVAGGDMILDGTLTLTAVGSPGLQAGNTLGVLTWGGTITGEFDSIDAFDLGGDLSWDFTNLYEDGTISVIPEPSSFALMMLLFVGGAMLTIKSRMAGRINKS